MNLANAECGARSAEQKIFSRQALRNTAQYLETTSLAYDDFTEAMAAGPIGSLIWSQLREHEAWRLLAQARHSALHIPHSALEARSPFPQP